MELVVANREKVTDMQPAELADYTLEDLQHMEDDDSIWDLVQQMKQHISPSGRHNVQMLHYEFDVEHQAQLQDVVRYLRGSAM